MLERLAQQSALSTPPAAQGVRLSELSGLTKIDLRGDPADRAFMTAVGRTLDLVLPTEPCTSLQKEAVGILWLGPDQWLITLRGDHVALMSGLKDELSAIHAAVTDVSAAWATFRLAGPNAKDVLAKGCPLDLHPSVVKPGFVAGSVLAKITALIHVQDDQTIDLHIGRSFADYGWAWLQQASLEYGIIVAGQKPGRQP